MFQDTGFNMLKQVKTITIAICLIALIVSPVAAGCKGKYGGIAGKETCPPCGAHIDECLSDYYDMTVATKDCTNYFFVGGWWFTAKELKKIPKYCIENNIDPYTYDEKGDHNNDGHPDNGNGCTEVPVPISGAVSLGFIGIVVYMNKNK